MSKIIRNHFELQDVCRSAGLWFVGSFMGEILDERNQWEDPVSKKQFVANFYNEYMDALDNDVNSTLTRINCVIRIIESKMVIEALNLVIEANDNKLGCDQSKINAKQWLEAIENGKIKY